MRNRQSQGLAAKKLAALKRKGGPGPLNANDLYGRIAASPDKNLILKAQGILKKYRFEPAANRTALAHKLSSVVAMYGEDAILDLAMIHPDRQLIASTVTETELREVGNDKMINPVVAPVQQTQPQYQNACGACALGMFNCEGGSCSCGCSGGGKAKMKNDSGETAQAKFLKEMQAFSPDKQENHTGIILGALALGLTIGVLATMAATGSQTK